MITKDKLQDVEFLSKCADPSFFIGEVLGYKPSKFHKEMTDEAMKNRYLLIEVPRGHAKTTMISKGYATWLLWKERGVEICLTASSLQQSKKVLNEIKAMITQNPFLKHLVPTDRETSWNKNEIETTNGNYLYIRPFNDSARGIQPNYLIYDDIMRLEDNNVTAEDKEDIFWSVFYPAGQTNRCKHFIVGTPAYEGDLFDKIEKNANTIGDWKHIHYACVEVDSAGNWVKPLWPERYDLSELKKIQSMMSPLLFAREYMCDPASSGGDIFSKDKLACALDHELNFSYETGEGLTIIGNDVAFSKSTKADWTVLIGVTVSEKPHTIVQYLGDEKSERTIENPIILNLIVRRKSVDINETLGIYESLGATRLVLDKSTGGVLVGADLRNKGINVDEQDFGPTNRQSMLINMSKIFDSERIVIPFKDPSTKMMVDILLKELKGMVVGKTKLGAQNIVSTTKHDDCVMALALALKPISTMSKSTAKLIFSANSPTQKEIPISRNKKDFVPSVHDFNSKHVDIPGI